MPTIGYLRQMDRALVRSVHRYMYVRVAKRKGMLYAANLYYMRGYRVKNGRLYKRRY